MRRSDFAYTAILLPLDYLMFFLAGILAYELRKTELVRNLNVVSNIFYEIPLGNYLAILAIIGLIGLAFFNFAGLYQPREIKKFFNQAIKVFLATTACISALVIFLFFRQEALFASRFLILASWILSILLIIFARGLVRAIRRHLLKYKIGAKPVIVVGQDRNTQHFISEINKRPEWGFMIVGQVHTLDALADKVRDITVESVILTDLNLSREQVNDYLEFCQTRHLDFSYAADMLSANLHNIEMDAIAGFPLIEIKRTPLEGWGRVKKRAIDILFSALAILILFIPGVIIGLIIKITSPGSIFVKLTRVGEQSKLFKIYKFRSMVQNADQIKPQLLSLSERQGPLFKMKNDPRITRVGKFLRRFSLDELPNFINALKGEMSLVGPRPHEPAEVNQYKNSDRKLLNIKPGVTGLAQISGRSNLPFDEEVRLDLYYIENWSLKLDLTILLKTLPAVLFKKDGAV
ncbi:MAG: hypothetical protein A2445_00755 [Candidatus Jacksonbacteria bacterium RIFOXYC2_FULL_44_29]|nr:MAG: hypothetical protein UV19_C0004G0026 [Parcubacteria group bacterium GW2011_GWA2_42_28]KKT55461.1 MAG: hypothetical protein UW45_C0007G0026 [Parcubacteria group bacterium GW2011_GWC2_44_22]OGY75231.1 MAG: hypothetical protein A2240_05850 [Candidatus Jacksonbacteria bacterium RIFOXYA2_FULL_43_12]OGY75934.1 MAG: hypothetical protein A2295_03355 [Candidatus Jacksonbacteria bacterium RIFOXYB2_FULL_44_15]OGY77949.1 MAG: hypothetical protein A2445_00755 [Candidatus Jacksonbacteria bacterium RI